MARWASFCIYCHLESNRTKAAKIRSNFLVGHQKVRWPSESLKSNCSVCAVETMRAPSLPNSWPDANLCVWVGTMVGLTVRGLLHFRHFVSRQSGPIRFGDDGGCQKGAHSARALPCVCVGLCGACFTTQSLVRRCSNIPHLGPDSVANLMGPPWSCPDLRTQ